MYTEMTSVVFQLGFGIYIERIHKLERYHSEIRHTYHASSKSHIEAIPMLVTLPSTTKMWLNVGRARGDREGSGDQEG